MHCLFLITTLRFTSGKTKIWSNFKTSQNGTTKTFSKASFFFLCLFEQLQFFQKGHIFSGIDFTFLERHAIGNLKVFNIQFGPQ